MQPKFRGWIICLLLFVWGLSLYAQQESPATAIQSDCLGRPTYPIRRPALPPGIMDRICKATTGGSQNPQTTSENGKANQYGTFTIFDPPSSTFTTPSAITADGTVVGSYSDASGVGHGFLRTPNGAFTIIDVPGSISTQVTAITPGGVITGSYCAAPCSGFPYPTYGFLRARDGSFTTFAPPAGAFLLSSIYTVGAPPSINPAGDVAGTYWYPRITEHGFLRTAGGAFITIDVPGATDFTEVLAINPAGTIVGDFCNESTCYHGFLRTPDGTFDEMNANAGTPMGINPAGAVTGFALDGTGAYLRTPDGTFITFNPPGSEYTSPSAINPGGVITGFYCDAIGCHNFLRAPDGTLTTFEPPGGGGAFPFAINPAGAVAGNYFDPNGVEHGFLYQP